MQTTRGIHFTPCIDGDRGLLESAGAVRSVRRGIIRKGRDGGVS